MSSTPPSSELTLEVVQTLADFAGYKLERCVSDESYYLSRPLPHSAVEIKHCSNFEEVVDGIARWNARYKQAATQ